MVTEREREPGVVTVGVLSDTHGYLYAEVLKLLEGVDHIIHAGDVGSPRVLEGLRAIAPVTAVRGNCDLDPWAASLPTEAVVELGGARILVGHIAGRLRKTLEGGGERGRAGDRLSFDVVVSGHSHRVEKEERDGALYLNPGSAGPERFGRPRTLARLLISARAQAEPSSADGVPARIAAELLVVPVS